MQQLERINSTGGRAWKFLLALAGCLFLVGLIRTAWIAEDAFITFRTIENFFAGYGLRWNVAERVQTYSHPLWMWLLCLGRWLTGETYYSALALGGLCSVGALYWVGFRMGLGVAGATCVWFVLALTPSFVDYSTSGLEAPLTHLLLALMAGVLFSDRAQGSRVLPLALLGGLAAVNRPDTLLLFLPAILWEVRLKGLRGSLWPLAWGFLPLVFWGAFATFYYGTPLPITAYAKAMTGISQGELFAQGLRFFGDALTRDPVLLPVLGLGLLVAFVQHRGADVALALGVLMYGLYLLKIGGGYMGGRFLTPPFFVGAILVGRWLRTVGRAWVAPAFLLGVFVLALQSHTLSALSPSTYNMRTTDGNELDIVDERGQWYPRTGLLASGRDIPAFGAVETLLDIRLSPQDPEIFLDGKVGLDGIVAGPGVHLVDPMLCDPLMMRLPVWDLNDWRIGHFMRRVPQGYLESLVSGDNRIDDPGLARAYEDLRLATRGGLFDPKRAKAIWSLAFGAGKRGLKSYVESGYRSPHTVVVSAQDLPRKVEAGARLWSDSSRVVTAGGVRVALPRISHSTQVTLGVGALAEYLLVIQKEGAELGRLELYAGESEKLFPGLIPLEVEIPSQVADSGWDAIEIHPLRNRRSGIHCLASMEGY